MPTPTFKRLSVLQFADLVRAFPFTRKVNAVHMHHTWKPSHREFHGHETIVGMWRFHTQEKGWRDIAQHITIDPNGDVWLGRNWNLAPASAAGHNGNESFGPFMFETIGNFDTGHDPFDGAQRETALQIIALVQARFSLPTDTLLFHNAMSPKSCPGTSLDYAEIVAAVEERRAALDSSASARSRRATRKSPFPDEPNAVIGEAIEALRRTPPGAAEPANAELTHHEHEEHAPVMQSPQPGTAQETARDAGLDAATLAALRPHLVSLQAGRFSSEGEATTTAADVDAIFEQHLEEGLAEAKAAGRKLRLLLYAHGGLVSESRGLQIAARHVDWWKRNGVYPIYFIWKTGLFETIGQLLERARDGSGRALGRDIFDFTTDPIIELAARVLQGPGIWDGMKWSAEHAMDVPSAADLQGGGAHYVAVKLEAFCTRNATDVELHAVGHSAGSIFHSHFLSMARLLGVPTFASAHFLAPAVRVDTFKERLAGQIGDNKAVRKLTLFTMQKDYEKADNCAGIYRKSLLYLIYFALENRRATPILGLEESLRNDVELKRLFGLDGRASAAGEVVWSKTQGDTGASASTSDSHGGFDDDAPTMNSVMRRVLGKADADSIVEFPRSRDSMADRPWIDEVDWPDSLRAPLAGLPPAAFSGGLATKLPPDRIPARPLGVKGYETTAAAPSGRRRALCVGIDNYPTPKHRLAGCVADARMWASTLSGIGFEISLLLDGQATRASIDRELRALIDGSRAGDVIVFQYAGHGTQVPDLNGDETDGKDEAICPVDFTAGALYIDDDIAEAFARVPEGVNLTCFTDCCHSASNTRFAVGLAREAASRTGRDERPRFVVATPEIDNAHARFRQRLGGGRAAGTGGQEAMRDVKFAACADHEVAWESDGHGEFTLRATRILGSGIERLTNAAFVDRVTAEFGPQARQHPVLDCGRGRAGRPLLQPLAEPDPEAATALDASSSLTEVDAALLSTTLVSIQHLLRQLHNR